MSVFKFFICVLLNVLIKPLLFNYFIDKHILFQLIFMKTINTKKKLYLVHFLFIQEYIIYIYSSFNLFLIKYLITG